MSKNPAHLRSLAAQMSDKGMRCDYCGVPTLATIEHVHPQAAGGRSKMHNLVLACPYCNTRKSTTDAEVFRASGKWKLRHPPLPATVQEMLAMYFGWPDANAIADDSNQVLTNSPHARFEIREQDDAALILIRPGRKYDWHLTNLGSLSNPKVVAAAYDFLARHYTPVEPKDPPPNSGKLWKEREPLLESEPKA